jgi:hypothetical protein
VQTWKWAVGLDKEKKMGWASGSSLMSDIIATIQENVDDHDIRVQIYVDIINAFEDKDADTLDECLDEDEAFDEAYTEVHPESDEDYE